MEWGFEAVEKLHGMDQYIDITDDVTGLPSRLAAKEIPMYGKLNRVFFHHWNVNLTCSAL